MKHQESLEEIFSLAGIPTESNWREAADIMIKHDIDTYEMVKYVDQEAPSDNAGEIGWIFRAEMFQDALYLKGAKEARLKGRL